MVVVLLLARGGIVATTRRRASSVVLVVVLVVEEPASMRWQRWVLPGRMGGYVLYISVCVLAGPFFVVVRASEKERERESLLLSWNSVHCWALGTVRHKYAFAMSLGDAIQELITTTTWCMSLDHQVTIYNITLHQMNPSLP